MEIGGHIIGVCSWSLQPKSMDDLAAMVRGVGLSHVQLALRPLITADEQTRADELRVLQGSGIQLTAGMINFAGEDYSSIAAIRKT